MTRQQRIDAINDLVAQGYAGVSGPSYAFDAHDDGSEEAPWLSAWHRPEPCPYPDMLRVSPAGPASSGEE